MGARDARLITGDTVLKTCVLGLWHLGTVTAACLANAGHDVTGLDFDRDIVDALGAGRPPLFEPGLEELVAAGLASKRLRFSTDAADAVSAADIVWVAYDTPVDDEDRADVDFVIDRVERVFPHLRDGALVLISSQMPVGATRALEERFRATSGGRAVSFSYSPENLRLGKAIAVFTQPDRVVVGVRRDEDRDRIQRLLAPFGAPIEWMSVESAEMTKHAINAFLAMSVTFINEIAALCEQMGADAGDVERGLKTETRIGPKAYLSAGPAFAGGTLARDVVFLSELGRSKGVAAHLLSSVKASNDAHKSWAAERVRQLLGGVSGQAIAVWGLTYKPGTDTLRRSTSLELCRALLAQGAAVRAHDPAVKALPSDLANRMILADSPVSAVQGASALIVATPWPEYRQINANDVATRMARGLVLDAGRFLASTLGRHPNLQYLSVGKATT